MSIQIYGNNKTRKISIYETGTKSIFKEITILAGKNYISLFLSNIKSGKDVHACELCGTLCEMISFDNIKHKHVCCACISPKFPKTPMSRCKTCWCK